MKIWLVYEGEYSNRGVIAAFTTKAAAQAFAGTSDVEAMPLWEKPPRPWRYWHRGAAVYPDGHVEDWFEAHTSEGERFLPPVDDHLNAEMGPWDGHMLGHCGEHISIVGTSKAQVKRAYQLHLAAALERADGICHSKFHKHSGDVDGVNVYDAGWLGRVRRRGNLASEYLACLGGIEARGAFRHDWKEWGAWREVADGQFNRQRACNQCTSITIQASVTTLGERRGAGNGDG